MLGGLLGAVLYVGLRDDTRVANVPVIVITDIDERQYVSEQSLLTYLQQHNCSPETMTIESIRQDKIEAALQAHPMIRHAECYVTVSGQVIVKVQQRVPLYKVTTGDGVYFIDTDRRIMPAWQSVTTKVMEASGNIGQRMAREELADLAEYISDSKYWREAIRSIKVHSPKQIILVEKSGRLVQLGEIEGYKRKLAKLKTFRDTPIPDAPQYYEVDLRYNGQVIGRK